MSEIQHLGFDVTRGAVYDVVVVGGGPSGVMAAVAAGREGMRTLVVEQYGCLGGSLAAMGVGPMMSFHNRAGRQLVFGLAQELVDRLQAKGASLGHILDSTGYCSTVTPFDSEALKIELETMAAESGVQVLYHTQLAAAIRDAEYLQAAVVCNKAGLTRYDAAVFVDATGDADLAARCGVPFQKGRARDGAMQPMTMNLKVAHVDMARLRAYVEAHPEEFDHGSVELLRQTPRVSLGGWKSAWERAKADGQVSVPREHVLFFEMATSGVVVVNTSRIQGLDPTDPFDLSRAEALGRKQCQEIYDFLRRECPGFEACVRVDAPAQVGVRESRHVQGLHTLTADDLLSQTVFADPVAVGGYPIDIHSPEGQATSTTHLRPDIAYQIPLRSLLLAAPSNLVMAGRAISATHEAAAAIRVTPIAMALGQAAGTVAAVAVRTEQPPNAVPYQAVRDVLSARNVYLA